MKRISTLILILVFNFIAIAGWAQSRLSITSMSTTPVRVMIDGREMQNNNNEIRIGNLSQGFHRIQIYAGDKSNDNRGWGRNASNRYGRMIYNTNLNIRYGMHTDIIINRFGKVFVDEQAIDNRYEDDWNNTGDRNGRGNDNRNQGRDDRNNDGWNNDRNYGMNANAFQQLKQQVKKENFDNRRLDLLRSVLPQNNISSDQVKDLAMIFDFERNKLDLAKFAYKYTVDRGNYFVVNDVFDFGNSKTELAQYISGYRD
ncbi:MAG: DUF4476 domain-containing protein [Lacibacter sp.]